MSDTIDKAEPQDGSEPLARPPNTPPVRILWRQWAMDRAVSASGLNPSAAHLKAMADEIFEWVMKR